MKKIAGSGFLVQQKNWCNYFYSIVHSIVLLIFIVHIIVCFHCRFHPQIPRKSQVPVGSPSRSCFRWIYLSNLATNLWQRAAWLARCWNLGGNWEDLAWWLEDDLYLCILIYIYHICVCVLREARSNDCNLSRTNRRRSSKDNPMDKTKMVDGYATYGENWPLTKTPWDGCKKQQTFCGSVPEVLDIATYVLFL